MGCGGGRFLIPARLRLTGADGGFTVVPTNRVWVAANPSCVRTTYYLNKAQGGGGVTV